jgi:hypothetical protein
MVFNLNIRDLTTAITSWNKNKNWTFFKWVGPGKNKIGIVIKFCKCYVIKRSPSNFLNKIQLKIKIKIEFFLTGSDPARTKFGIAIKFCKCYVIKRSPSNFSNKIQLKIKIKIDFFYNWVRPGLMHLVLDRTRSDQNNGRNSGEWLHCSHAQSIVHLSEQWRVNYNSLSTVLTRRFAKSSWELLSTNLRFYLNLNGSHWIVNWG